MQNTKLILNNGPIMTNTMRTFQYDWSWNNNEDVSLELQKWQSDSLHYNRNPLLAYSIMSLKQVHGLFDQFAEWSSPWVLPINTSPLENSSFCCRCCCWLLVPLQTTDICNVPFPPTSSLHLLQFLFVLALARPPPPTILVAKYCNNQNENNL